MKLGVAERFLFGLTVGSVEARDERPFALVEDLISAPK